jgi:hypothetical protein
MIRALSNCLRTPRSLIELGGAQMTADQLVAAMWLAVR